MNDLNLGATAPAWVSSVAVLTGYLNGFESRLVEQGYVAASIRQKVDLAVAFVSWIERRDVSLEMLGDDCADRFLRGYRRAGARRGDAWTIRQFLGYLRTLGCIPSAVATVEPTAADHLVLAFGDFLCKERGLSSSTLSSYLPIVRAFLDDQFRGRAPCLDKLHPADVHRFVVRQAQAISLSRAKLAITALRSFLRFLQQRGLLRTDLSAAVPGVAGWRLTHLPKAMSIEQVEQLLASCDRRMPAGRRDYAILMLLARLGLRGGEVSALTLDDIDWEHGEIAIHGKGQRLARLPLPADVGAAIADYLRRDRPVCSTRRVFIRIRAPRRGFVSLSVICCILRRALKRAGLDPAFKGAHLLRHSLATDLLRRGASLAEIGQVLRHSQPNTTQIYAKVDITALRAIALPWPEAQS
jgi:integrase/recombinase XerD